MLIAIICAIVAIMCLTQGAVEGAIALGILSAVLFFMFGSNKSSQGSQNTQPKQVKKPQPAPEHRATPYQIAHYRSSPVVAQIVREIQNKGAVVSLSLSKGGHDLTASGGNYYKYVFKDHGYQSLTLQEQEAFLRAIVEQLPHAETYVIGYEHVENSVIPHYYFAKTSFYQENQYRWNPATGAWEKMTKL
jgi:hypothetical protein